MVMLLFAGAIFVSCSNSSGNNNSTGGNSDYYGTWEYNEDGEKYLYVLNILDDEDCQLTIPAYLDPFQIPYQGHYVIDGKKITITGTYNEFPVIITGIFKNNTTLVIDENKLLGFPANSVLHKTK